MPVFGKSLFETVLDGMDVDEVDEDEETPVRRPRIVAPFLADTSLSDDDDERAPGGLGGLYEDFGAPAVPEAAPPPSPEPPAWLNRLADQDVVEDLGLAAGMTKSEIREKRRAFARLNHPDRVAERYRDAATIRMTIANRLVEAALRKA